MPTAYHPYLGYGYSYTQVFVHVIIAETIITTISYSKVSINNLF